MMASLCFAAGALAALTYWPLAGRAPDWTRSLLKTGATAALAVAAVLAGASPWLVLGLALGALGDYALSRPGTAAFRAGLGAFLLGHLAYVVLFLVQDDSAVSRPFLWPGAVLSLLLAILVLALVRPLWRGAGALRGPVMAYVMVIAAMGLAALSLPLPHGGQLAAALFIASDAVLAAELFLIPAAHPARSIAPRLVWPLYWAAQALFLWTFAF